MGVRRGSLLTIDSCAGRKTLTACRPHSIVAGFSSARGRTKLTVRIYDEFRKKVICFQA